MGAKPYPVYKDSGVEWIGDIPKHWEVKRIKQAAHVQLGKMLQPESSTFSDLLMPYLRSVNVQDSSVSLDDVKLMWASPYEVSQYSLRSGDVLVNEGGDVGRCCLLTDDLPSTVFQNSINRLRPLNNGSPGLLFYWMKFLRESGYVELICNKSTIAHFTAEKVARSPLFLPPLQEQKQIASFLDRETSRIDTLIDKQQQLINLLKEKQGSLISHTVTKGLNPNVPMKDSGVEWIGEIPEHWVTCSLGLLTKISTGSTPDRDRPEYWNGGIPWIKTGEINYSEICQSEESISHLGLVNSAAKIASKGTLLMAMYGQGVTRGRVAILGIDAAYNQACAAIVSTSRITTHYLRWFFMAAYPYVRDYGNETSQMNLSSSYISKIKTIVPSLAEQEAITDFLDRESSKFDTLIEKANQSIALLKERRSSLISAAVTGKIDVREAA